MLQRLSRGLSVSLGSALALILAGVKVSAAPANPEQLRTYAMIGAMNICVLNTLEVDFDKSILASAIAITRVIEDKHESRFEGFTGSKELWSSEEDIRQGVAVQVSLLVNHLCGDKFEGSNEKKLQATLDSIQKSGIKVPQ